MNFNHKQSKQLKRLCESPIIRKSKVKILALGVGLIGPKTEIDMMAIKLIVGSERKNKRINKVINVHE